MAMGGTGRERRFVSEINVTPLVDVMLVLLIIFMVTAPMMTQGLDIDLPETTAKELPQPDDALVVTVDKDGIILFNKVRYDSAGLSDTLRALPGTTKEQPIYLRADKEVVYGAVVDVMTVIKQAGFEKLGMITQPKEKTK